MIQKIMLHEKVVGRTMFFCWRKKHSTGESHFNLTHLIFLSTIMTAIFVWRIIRPPDQKVTIWNPQLDYHLIVLNYMSHTVWRACVRKLTQSISPVIDSRAQLIVACPIKNGGIFLPFLVSKKCRKKCQKMPRKVPKKTPKKGAKKVTQIKWRIFGVQKNHSFCTENLFFGEHIFDAFFGPLFRTLFWCQKMPKNGQKVPPFWPH